MNAHFGPFPIPDARGAVAQAPDLPAGFAETFRSRMVEAGGLRQHVVVGGNGPALLLVHGWPESWYAWRLVMPTLARSHRVIAVDQRGTGLTGKPEDGYDAGTLAGDLVALMDELGHGRFSVVGHDTGMIIGYALAADHPERVSLLVVAELPGPPGAGPSPSLFVPKPFNDRLWHIPFNRAGMVAELLIQGREDIFFGHVFATGGGRRLPGNAIEYYIENFSDERSLRGGLGIYRDWDVTLAQNERRMTRPVQIPVLAVGGADGWAEHVAEGMQRVAVDVQGAVITGAGHWVAEQSPEELVAVLGPFLTTGR